MLTFDVIGQRLLMDAPLVVEDSNAYLEAQFNFHDEDWQTADDIWAHFEQDDKRIHLQVKNNRIEKSANLNLDRGYWKVYLHASSADGERITTNQVDLQVKKTGTMDGEVLPEIPLSAAEQISLTAAEARQIAQSVRDDADAGEFIGETGPKGDPGFSPVVSSAEVEGGHEVSITDSTHTETIMVRDGLNGVSEEDLTEAIDEVKEMISEAGVQSDLSETDSTSKAYVKGKLQERHIPDSLARKDEIPTTPQEVGADPTGTAETAVSTHNTATDAHSDIRLLIEGLTTRLNTIANSTDVDLDQLAEIVAYIKNNKSLIDGITTSKVNVTDIIDNLTTNVSNKPLSAAQGVVLKGLIDGLSSGKLDASKLTEAINTALAQAKASGEFDGDSVTVANVQESTADGGSNVVTFSDGKTLTVKNGSKGSTPVKGTDYYTAADKTEMVNAVIAALPTWTGGSY